MINKTVKTLSDLVTISVMSYYIILWSNSIIILISLLLYSVLVPIQCVNIIFFEVQFSSVLFLLLKCGIL